MDSERMDILDNYAFHFLEDVEEPFIQLVAIGRESRHSSRYHLENSGRGASYLFQYTLAGSGTVRINAIFECHGAQRYCGQIESHLGGRPIDYLTKIRLDRAVDMLTAGERSVREVGEESGFSIISARCSKGIWA